MSTREIRINGKCSVPKGNFASIQFSNEEYYKECFDAEKYVYTEPQNSIGKFRLLFDSIGNDFEIECRTKKNRDKDLDEIRNDVVADIKDKDKKKDTSKIYFSNWLKSHYAEIRDTGKKKRFDNDLNLIYECLSTALEKEDLDRWERDNNLQLVDRVVNVIYGVCSNYASHNPKTKLTTDLSAKVCLSMYLLFRDAFGNSNDFNKELIPYDDYIPIPSSFNTDLNIDDNELRLYVKEEGERLDYYIIRKRKDNDPTDDRNKEILIKLWKETVKKPSYVAELMEDVGDADQGITVMRISDRAPESLSLVADDLTIEEKNSIISSIIQAIKNLHSRDITYRSLTPKSFLVCKSESEIGALLYDMGVSKHIPSYSEMSVVGSVYETAGEYAAPEVKQRENITKAADIYSLGMIIKFITKSNPEMVNSEVVNEMLSEDPKRRPDINYIETKVFSPLDDGEYRRVIKEKWPDLEVQNRIGKGAYGYVFRCVKNEEGLAYRSECAVKVMKITTHSGTKHTDINAISKEHQKESFDELKESAENEIRLLDNLGSSPNIVHINDYGLKEMENHSGIYILIRMDLYDKNLKNCICEHKNDSTEQIEILARKVCRDMCTALEKVFENKTIHRDIKPENIFFKEGNYYLGDFGISMMNSQIKKGTYGGTFDYMAPEARETEPNQLTDLYSLGMVLYRIVNHDRIPFEDPSNEDDARNIAINKRNAGIEPIPFPDNCREDLGKIIVKMCAHNPKERFQSISEIYQALNRMDKERNNRSLEQNVHVENNYTQINNNQSLSVNNVHYSNSESTTAVATNGRSGSFDWEKALKIIIPIAAVLIIALGIGFFALISRVLSNASSKNHADDIQSTITESDDLNKSDSVEPSSKNNQDDKIFNEKSNDTGIIETKETEPKEDSAQGVKLSSMDIVEKNHSNTGFKDSAEDTLGNKYNNALCVRHYFDPAYAKFYLGGKYEKFRCRFACDDISYNGEYRLTIYGEDRNNPLYLLDFSRTLPVTPIEIDVREVEFITFEVSGEGDYGGIISDGVFFVEAADDVTGSGLIEEPAQDTKINSMKIVERNHSNTGFKDSVDDTLGNKYNNVLCVRHYFDPAYAKFYLGGKYKEFRCIFACDDISYNGEYRLTIYGEDRNDPLYLLDFSRTLPVTPIEIDVSGVDFITFEVSGEGDYGGIISDGVFFVEAVDGATDSRLIEEPAQDTKINSMKIVERNHSNTGFKDSADDTLGNKYNNVLCVRHYFDPAYAKFYLGGKYSKFKCKFACDDISYNNMFRLEIYGDDGNNPLYSLDFSRALPVTPIEIDVSGVEFITFEVNGEGDYGGIISDGVFSVL